MRDWFAKLTATKAFNSLSLDTASCRFEFLRRREPVDQHSLLIRNSGTPIR
jgi:hypothetical protein